ncbi:unnamed protein product, partial [Iphiclides podalirius]
MGITYSRSPFQKRKIDEATSNASLSTLHFALNSDKPKWNVFWKRRKRNFPAFKRKKSFPLVNAEKHLYEMK